MSRLPRLLLSWIAFLSCTAAYALGSTAPAKQDVLSAADHPYFERVLQLVHALDEGELRQQLLACKDKPITPSEFSIAHRGAPLGYPEHTLEGYIAAARMGAGVIECDVTFTQDGHLVCRHSQCDLHRTTNILKTPLASQCTQTFRPARAGHPAEAKCCTSDITLAQFRKLCGRRDQVSPAANTVAEYLHELPSPVSAEPVSCGTLMTHAESIALIDQLGASFIPELKAPQVAMPFRGMSQADYANKMLGEYTTAGINSQRVSPQSFVFTDIQHWIAQSPAFADQVVYLDPRGRQVGFRPSLADMQTLRAQGVTTLAPPIPMLLQLDDQGRIQATDYARYAHQAGLKLMTWTFENGAATDPDNWLYRSLPQYVQHESQILEVLHALHTQAGISGIFSDWPATTTYYANCFDL